MYIKGFPFLTCWHINVDQKDKSSISASPIRLIQPSIHLVSLVKSAIGHIGALQSAIQLNSTSFQLSISFYYYIM